LDTKANLSGEDSYWTEFENKEIMFHVAPLLPFVELDSQKVDRKKHLGNDVIIVIFKEGNEPLDPTIFRSQFNHVFCVIQIDKSKTTAKDTFYEVAFLNKPGVPPFGPYLPQPAVFQKNPAFRRFLLAKLINAERAAMHTPHFHGRMRAKKEMLEQITEKCNMWLKKKPSGDEKEATSSSRFSSRGSKIVTESSSSILNLPLDTTPTPTQKDIKVILRRYSEFEGHPVTLPSTRENLLSIASTELGIQAANLRSINAEQEITDLSILKANDVVLVTTEEEENNLLKKTS